MKRNFKIGDYVTWNSEAGHVSGTIVKVHTKHVEFKGYTHHASRDEPQSSRRTMLEALQIAYDHFSMKRRPSGDLPRHRALDCQQPIGLKAVQTIPTFPALAGLLVAPQFGGSAAEEVMVLILMPSLVRHHRGRPPQYPCSVPENGNRLTDGGVAK